MAACGAPEMLQWEVEVKGKWNRIDYQTCQRLTAAMTAGKHFEPREAHGRSYLIDLQRYVQLDRVTGERFAVRCGPRLEEFLSENEGSNDEDEDDDSKSRCRGCTERIAEGCSASIAFLRDRLKGAGGGTSPAAAASVLELADGNPPQRRIDPELARRLCGFSLLFIAIVFIFRSALLSASAGGGGGKGSSGDVYLPPPSPRGRPPWAAPSSPGAWHVCQAQGDCGGADILRAWETDPIELAWRVTDDMASLPVVPAEVWAQVSSRWRQAPPSFQSVAVTLEMIAKFMKTLLASDPFHLGSQVPHLDLAPPFNGKAVSVTQRQLAFIVSNALMGNRVAHGRPDGLSSALERCGKMGSDPSYVFSLLSLLAVLSQELADGEQGSTLVAAMPVWNEGGWRAKLSQGLVEPTICRRSSDGSFDCGLDDFMAGGTPNQALVDIAGGVVGGGAQLCGVAASQDESLVQFYSEVLAFSFFTIQENSDDSASGMLPSPLTLLGARRYMSDITGESMSGSCGRIATANWLNEDIPTGSLSVVIGDGSQQIAASAFVGIASVCSLCVAGDSCTQNDAVNNACDAQRRQLDKDLNMWYMTFDSSNYNLAVQEAHRAVISRIGTGPWGSGVWYGDSQAYFLTLWLGASLLNGVGLDYYIYEAFCENPGNQCLVLSESEGCAACIASSTPGTGIRASSCGARGIRDMVSQFQGSSVNDLYKALTQVGKPPKTVFDLLGS